MHINKWLNPTPVALREIQLGNVFHYPIIEPIIITGVILSGKIQYADNKGDIKELEDITKLLPVKLPDGANVYSLQAYLEKTDFKQFEQGHFICNYHGGLIHLKQQLLFNRWLMSFENEIIAVKRPIYYLHEMQNTFNFITGNKLKLF